MFQQFNDGRLSIQLSQIEAVKCTPPQDPKYVQLIMRSGTIHDLNVPEGTNAVAFAAALVLSINNQERNGGDPYVVQKVGR